LGTPDEKATLKIPVAELPLVGNVVRLKPRVAGWLQWHKRGGRHDNGLSRGMGGHPGTVLKS